ncbi:hypothetical protein CGRA01v4_08264 [Colletotrichum graminicola]|uniref:BTB domain-containing protein n=1 Tax=Colletotrichum graminicola (strain M1.001 / M2 / FGSC 10212) TaxID=645133 RepID=E3QMN5_COLGM|nr:uncharacterized protein GLRG_07267 [Colletotrichum graminicola M1.001]EFQ32123.1 hypothetical protein GLRG_07267 [Colletotrichum graminicola M1.001]WDK16981.1 hypothetical protein CGRA01v4_08264 [Colletotrichum graminicola]
MAMAARCIDNLESVLASRVITFLIGPEKQTFHINEQLVISCSGVFKRMLTNGMRESQEGVVELEDQEPHIFTSFIHYILYGNYEASQKIREMKITVETADEEAPVRAKGHYDSLTKHVSQMRPLVGPTMPYLKYMESFLYQGDAGRLYAKPSGLPTSESPDLEKSLDPSAADSQFGLITAHHVKLYVFADKYDVGELRQLCLHRLHNTLIRTGLSETGYRYLFEAIAFTFENTCPGDKIRKLFVQTCVADLVLVRHMPGYKDLCCQVPELAYEMMIELPEYWNSHIYALRDVAGKFLDR